MAESDRPTPDAKPQETPDVNAAQKATDLGEVVLADGTPVGEGSQGATAEEMDELLSLFEEELTAEEEADPTAGMSEQEAAQEDLVRQAEALLGTTDPTELEELAQVHKSEAAEQYARIAQQRSSAESAEEAAVAETAPPPEPESKPEPASEPEAAPEPTPQPEPATAEAAPAEPEPVATPVPDLAEDAGAADDLALEPVAARQATRGGRSALVGALFRLVAWPIRFVVSAIGGVLWGLLGLFRLRWLFPAGEDLSPALQRFALSKGRLAVTTGLLAAFAAYLGFALFDARFSAAVLQRRYPDAVGKSDMAYYRAVGELQAGQFARARQRLRPLAEAGGSARAADVQFALGEAYFLDAAAPTNLRFMRARQHYLDAIAADPTHPRVIQARMRIAESYRGQELWPEAEAAYRLVLERYQQVADIPATLFALAEMHLQQRRFDTAAESFERVWNEYPESPLAISARLRHGDTFAAAGQMDQAQGMWAQLTEAQTPAAVRWEAVARMAERAEAQGDVRAAIAWWEAWLKGSHDVERQADVLLTYANLLQAAGNGDASAASLTHLLTAYPDHPAAVVAALQRGATLLAAGDTREARELYADGLQAAPGDPRLLMAMHDAYTQEAQWDRALEYAERVTAVDPTSSQARLVLARAYINAGRPARGMKVYWEMVARYPLAVETQTAVYELTALLQKNGYTTEAYRVVDLYSTVAADKQSRAAMHEAKAGLLIHLGLWAEAAGEYAAAIAAQPSPRLRLQLADAQAHTRDWPGVLAPVATVKADALEPEDAARLLALQARALLQSGRASEAAALLAAKTVNVDPLPLRLQGLRAEALMAQGATTDAREMMAAFDAARTAESEIPLDLSPTYLAWAEHLFAQRIYSRSAEYYAQVTGDGFNEHDRAWAAYQVGNCYAQLQDYPRAVEAYERMIEAHPRAPWVPFAREKAQFALLQADTTRSEGRT